MSNSVTPGTAAHQASLSITNSQSLLKLMMVMPSNHLILCHPLLLLPSISHSIRVFSNESVLRIRWPKYQSINFSISPSNEYSGLISFKIDLIAQLVKNLPAIQEILVQFLGQEDPLEKGTATHSSILAWKIPWTRQSMESQRVRQD